MHRCAIRGYIFILRRCVEQSHRDRLYVPEMMCKMSSILLVVASMFVLVAGNCMEKIRNIEEKTKGENLIGGYRPIKDPKNNAVVKRIVADGIKAHNERSNDMFKSIDDGKYVAYQQLVNGQNFCCQFQIKSDGCKNAANSEVCQQKKTRVCTIEAFKAFDEEFATIKQDSMQCSSAAKA